MFCPFVERSGRFILIGVSCWACAARLIAAGHEDLVQANFKPLNDGQGTVWNVQPQGTLNTGSNAFNNAMSLNVGNINFTPQQMQMTRDQREYVLAGPCGNVHVMRRIKFDAATASVRYVEILTNNGPNDLAGLMVRLTTAFQMQAVPYSDSGRRQPHGRR